MPAEGGARTAALLRAYLAPLWRQALLLLALMLAGVGLELAIPQLVRGFIDQARAGAPLEALLWVGAGFLGVALVAQGALVAEQYIAGDVAWRATNRLRADLARHVLSLDMGYHGAHPPGELVERVDGDVAKLSEFFSQFLVRLAGNVLLLAGILALSLGIDWRVALALGAFSLVSLAALGSLRRLGSREWEAQRRVSAGLFGFLEEYLSGTEDLRANGGTGFALRRLAERQRHLLGVTQRAMVRGNLAFATTTMLLAVGTAVGLLLGAWLYRAGAITLGSVYLIFAYTELLRRPLEEIGRQVQQLQQASASVTRIGELLSVSSRVGDGPGRPLPGGPLPLAFEGVTFRYEDDAADPEGRPVLRDVSFSLAPGEVLGLLGRTGSGKTTLARLVFRLYDPQLGRVTLAGSDLRGLRQREVRGAVGLVTQDIQLFHATVRDNLTFFDPSVPDERVAAALEEVGLGRWLASLPEGLDTRLAPDGGGLSAGQAQLLAFVRVFLRDPGLVILDEASSRLDPATERALERAVDRLLAGRTAIIIAHRLPTVERADSVLILEGGEVLEHGPRKALAADPSSRLSRLLRAGIEEALV